MNLLVVDASVAIKWYVPEAGTQAAVALLENGDTLYAPDLLLSEAANILWKKVKLGELTPSEGREILHAMNQAPIQIEPAGPLIESAHEIACGLQRTVYAGLYLALAVHLQGVMVTADKKLCNAIRTTELAGYIALIEGV